jgi:hypothetical protein
VRWLAHFATCSVYRCLSGSVRATAGSAIIASYHRQYLPHQPNRHGACMHAGRQAGRQEHRWSGQSVHIVIRQPQRHKFQHFWWTGESP